MAEDVTPVVEYEADHLRPWCTTFQKWNPNHPFGFVYFIQAVNGGPIKIGLTTRPASRLRELQNSSPYKLVITRTIRVHREKLEMVEREFHTRFAYARLEGGWFRPVPELVRIAEAVPDLEALADPGLDRLAAALKR